MTRRALRRTRFLTLLFPLICLALFGLTAIYLFGRGFTEGSPRALHEMRRLWKAMDPPHPALNIFIAGGACLLGAVGSIRLHVRFGRDMRRELLFFRFFLASLGLHVTRPLVAVFLHAGSPMFAGLALTKLAYLGEFTGLFALFAQSFYAFNDAFRREGTVLSVIACTGFFLAYSLTVDITELRPDLLFQVGREDHLAIARLVFVLLCVGNYVRAAAIPRPIAASIALIASGQALLFVGLFPPAGLAGLAALAAGMMLFLSGRGKKINSTAEDSR